MQRLDASPIRLLITTDTIETQPEAFSDRVRVWSVCLLQSHFSVGVDEAAPLLGVARRHVYTLAESRDPAARLPAVRIGRLLMFRPQDLKRWIEERVEGMAS